MNLSSYVAAYFDRLLGRAHALDDGWRADELALVSRSERRWNGERGADRHGLERG